MKGDMPKTYYELIKFLKNTNSKLLVIFDDVEELIIKDPNHLSSFLNDFKDMQSKVKFLMTSKIIVSSFVPGFNGLELRVDPLEIQFTEKLF